MYLCDRCCAELVQSKRLKPLTGIYGANNIPFKLNDKCEKCNVKENVWLVPDHEIKVAN